MESSEPSQPTETIDNLSTQGLNGDSQKIHFQLNPTKSKNARAYIRDKGRDSNTSSFSFIQSAHPENTLETGIADAAAAETARRQVEGTSLIIPLQSDSTSRFKRLQQKLETSYLTKAPEDLHDPIVMSDSTSDPIKLVKGKEWDAIQAIAREALGVNADKASAGQPKVLSIPSTQEDNDKVLFQQDIVQRADELTVDSAAYIQVPISEFGAAMLRGMGWNDTLQDSNTIQDKNIQPRHQRLGLGAIPKRLGDDEDQVPGKKGTSDKKNSKESFHSNEKERKAVEQKHSVQGSLQVGSIVWISKDDLDGHVSSKELHEKHRIRARVEQTTGVPGLNRVLVAIEGSHQQNMSIDRKKLTLLSFEDVEKSPFLVTEKDAVIAPTKQVAPPAHDSHINKGKKRGHDEREFRERHSSKYDSYEAQNVRKHRSDRQEINEADADASHGGYSEYKNSNCRQPWLLPHIRVRVISEKIQHGKMFKQKGIVLDVLQGGLQAVLQMDNGTLLENVPERYLETALPKAGGRVIILKGPLRLSLGKLLERNTDCDRGVIQLDVDLSVKKLPLDDIAEYCGSYD